MKGSSLFIPPTTKRSRSNGQEKAWGSHLLRERTGNQETRFSLGVVSESNVPSRRRLRGSSDIQPVVGWGSDILLRDLELSELTGVDGLFPCQKWKISGCLPLAVGKGLLFSLC